jgi:hypothetical protein
LILDYIQRAPAQELQHKSKMSLLTDDWKKNATYLLGIPLHPQGEMNTFEYVMLANGDLDELRARSTGARIQLLANAIANYVFVRNLWLSIRMLMRRSNVIPHWCCFFQSIFGVIYTICALMLGMPGGPSCRVALWVIGVGLTVSPICVSIILLQKAYIVCGQNRMFLIFGSILIIPQLATWYYAWTSPAIMVPDIGCRVVYVSYYPWLKFGIEAPTVVLFSVVFLKVVYQQYRMFGSEAWVRLARNGIQTMCLIIFCNFICMLLAAINLFGAFSQTFIILDWVIASILLVSHGIRVGFKTHQSDSGFNARADTLPSKTATGTDNFDLELNFSKYDVTDALTQRQPYLDPYDGRNSLVQHNDSK